VLDAYPTINVSIFFLYPIEETAMTQADATRTRPFWATNLVRTCVNVQVDETLLIVTDEPLAYVRDTLLAEAMTLQPAALWSYTVPDRQRPLTGLPAQILNLAKEVDAIIALFAIVHMDERVSPRFIQDLLTMYTGGARVAVGGYITQDILDHEVSADYQQIDELCSALADRLQDAASIHITTSLGTDLHLSVAGRTWKQDTGLFRGPGWGNVPAGEVFIARVEESADGVLVIDASLPGLALTEPVRIRFERGRAVTIEGGAGAAYLEQAFKNVEGQPNSDWSRVIGEFGIGTNPKARIQGNIMTDEKVLGTVHIALGRNDMWGGKNAAPIHLDGVVSQPTVHIDGKLLIDNGRYVVNV
jgi:leucyl aminopeptidase (aminopeptidase T)